MRFVSSNVSSVALPITIHRVCMKTQFYILKLGEEGGKEKEVFTGRSQRP